MKKLTFLAGIALVLCSCNSGNKNSSDSPSEISKENSVSGNVNVSDCLESFEKDYEKLLSKEDMVSVFEFNPENAKHNLRSGGYGEHNYRWESDRAPIVTTILNQEIKGPDYNSIGIANLSFYDDDSELKSNKDYFDRGYKTLSEAELKQIEDNLAKQSDEVKKSGEGFMEVRKKSQWEFVDGVGTSAWYKWHDTHGGELAVLSGRAKFDILVKVSKDRDENRDLAKKLAQKVIDKCK